ncbi:MAG: transporter substrate-binding domain-containing protein, partial [Erysipelotrichaceae bacterium]
MKKVLTIVLSLMLGFSAMLPVFASQAIQFTAEEVQFIHDHPIIRLGVDPNFIPYEFIDTDGSYAGMASDYLKIIAERTGLQFSVVKDLTWSQAYEKGVLKQLDMLPSVGKTIEREKYFLFSDPYLSFRRVIFVRSDETKIHGIADLANLSVAVQMNSSHQDYLATFPKINLSLYGTVEEAIKALSEGKERVFVGNLATTSYLIKKAGITNLKYMTIDSQEETFLYFAVRNDWPILKTILNKALATITDKEKITIQNQWLGLNETTDYSGLIRNILIGGAILLLLIGVSFYWITRLRKEIGRRKIVEEELKIAKQDAEIANQTKTSFLARMSHEIRTPLHAITGISYLAERSELTSVQRGYFDKIIHAADDMLNIINDILDINKVESGKTEIEKVPFYIDDMLDHLITLVVQRANEQKIKFEVHRDPAIGERLIGDPKRLQQILLNLLNNAVKFTNKGYVSLDIEKLIEHDGRCLISFEIKDTGIGMSQEQIDKVFTPYTQADASISRRYGGSGLGLSIAKNLVELMSGTIEVTSELDVGTTFNVEIAFDIAPPDPSMKSRNSDTRLAKLGVLLLSGDEMGRSIVSSYLASFKVRVKIVATPEEAIEEIRLSFNQPIDKYSMLLLDDESLDRQGIDIAAKVKALKGAETLKTMLMVEMADDRIAEIHRNPNIDFLLTKPIIPSLLFNAMIEIFRLQSDYPAVIRSTVRKTNPYCVLVVDDNQTNRWIAQTVLTDAGMHVTTCENGLIAFEMIQADERHFDIILMDLHMP